MPVSLYYKWQEFYELEPWGAPWQNWLMAVPATDFAKAHCGKGRRVNFTDYIYRPKEMKYKEKAKTFFSFLRAKAVKK